MKTRFHAYGVLDKLKLWQVQKIHTGIHLWISRVFADREQLVEGALNLAATIAGKSPVAVQATKLSMVYSRDHSVAEGLDHVVSGLL